MANIKSIGGNPIVLGLDGLTDDAKAAFGNGRLSATSESLLGADSTAQWATRESTGSGSAIVRSVQGATEVQNGALVPVRIAGMKSTGFNLLNIHRDVVITNVNAAEYSDGSNRKFAENQMWVGMTINNIMSSASISSYEVGEEAVTVTANNTGYGITFPIRAMPSAQYYVGSESSSDAIFGIGLYDANGDFITYRPEGGVVGTSFVFSTTADTHWLTVCMRPNRNVTTTFNRPTLNINDPARNGEYEPYRIVDAIEWTAQTLRAAGSVRDELTADELVTRVGVTTVTGANYWNAGSAAYNGDLATDRYVIINGAIPDGAAPHPINVRVTDFTTVSNPSVGIWETPDSHVNECRMNGTQLHICFSNALVGITTDMTAAQRTEAIKTWLNAHPQEVWYELATPTTQPISPALPMTYKVQAGGSESIIVPDGEVSAAPIITVAEGESAADLVMDALAAIAAPDGPTATSNHAINTYLTMQGKLYKVTRAIAAGETIVAGTNVSETTVMAELIARTA